MYKNKNRNVEKNNNIRLRFNLTGLQKNKHVAEVKYEN